VGIGEPVTNNEIDVIRKVLTQNADVVAAFEKHGVKSVDIYRICERALAFAPMLAALDGAWSYLGTKGENRPASIDKAILDCRTHAQDVLKREEVQW
jgi:hypothetical protein